MTRQNRGYLDSGQGRFDASPLILTRVFSALTRSRVVLPSLGVTLAAVSPIVAVTGDAWATFVAGLCLYPFCHLAHRYRRGVAARNVGGISSRRVTNNQKKERKR